MSALEVFQLRRGFAVILHDRYQRQQVLTSQSDKETNILKIPYNDWKFTRISFR